MLFVISRLIEAGLPNLTGNGFLVKATARPTGLLQNTGTRAANNGEGNAGVIDYATFDASRCNSIYGSSSTVTPLSMTTAFLIKY